MFTLLLSLLIWPAGAAGQVIVDNARVDVRDVSWPKGEAPERTGHDTVIVYLSGRTAGEVVFAKGGISQGSAPAAGASRAITVELKDGHVQPYVNTSGQPNAFPRPGSRKVLENDRVVVWDYTWTTGHATPTHFHDKDVVVIYLADGALTSTTPDGVSTVNPHSFGFAKFNPGNRVHTEMLTRGEARAIIIELK